MFRGLKGSKMKAAEKTESRSRISVHEAETIILSYARPMPSVDCPLEAAAGRLLRENLVADRDFPPFDRVTMDGIAVRAETVKAGIRRFRIHGTQAAGAPRMTLSDSSGCIEVMTGAMLPNGTDCVIRVEDVHVNGHEARIHDEAEAEPLQFVHRKGSDYRSGDLLVPAGRALNAPLIAICASLGKSSVLVADEPRIAVVATGDELVPVDTLPDAHQIRMSNPYAIAAALGQRGYSRLEIVHVADDTGRMIDLLGGALSRNDVIVISGGVSAGKFDLVPSVLARLGVDELFHRVLQRPGLPLWFGAASGSKVVFALPGNPVSSLVSTIRYVLPFLAARRMGTAGTDSSAPTEFAVLAEEYAFEPELTLFLPVALDASTDGSTRAHPQPVHGSGDFARLSESAGFIELPARERHFPRGSAWPLYRWSPR